MSTFVSVRRCWRACAFLGVWLAAHSTASALTFPPVDSSSPFAEYSLGLSQGKLYLHTGDSIYQLGKDGGGNDEWQLRLTGLESAFAGGLRGFEGDFAVAPNGTAAMSMGYTDGGVLLIDLNALTTAEVPTLDAANLFSLAGAADGSFVGMNAFFDTSTLSFNATQIVRIDPVTRTHSVLIQELAPGEFSGGVAFDGQGNLYLSTFVSSFPSPTGTASFWFVDAMDLGSPSPTAALIGTATGVNGANALVLNGAGDLFFGSQSGVGVLRHGTMIGAAFYGDLGEDVFGGPTKFQLTGGLVVDPAGNDLLLIDNAGQAPSLLRLVTTVVADTAIPEPTWLMLIGFSMLAAMRQRSHGGH